MTLNSSRARFLWGISGLGAGFGWFLYNISLDGLYKGRVCCDSTQYISIAERFHALSDIFNLFGIRTFGFPLFLAAHKWIAEMVGWPNDWVPLALVTSFVLYELAAYALYLGFSRKFGKLHPAVYFLLAAHPGLTSHAALPLTDTLATTLLMFAVTLLITVKVETWGLLNFFKLFAAGWLFGYAIVVRPSLWPPLLAVSLIVTLLLLTMQRKFNPIRLQILAGFLGAGLSLWPATVACQNRLGEICLTNPTVTHQALTSSFSQGLSGARAWTSFIGGNHLMSVADPFLAERLGSHCEIGVGQPAADTVRCLISHWPILSIFFIKKTIGLLDNFHLNTYSADITEAHDVIWNRLFNLFSVAGLVACLFWLWQYRLAFVTRDTAPELHLQAFGFCFALIYLAYAGLFHVESRYSFPAVPFLYIAFGKVLVNLCDRGGGKTHKRHAIFGIVCMCFIFAYIYQVLVWDSLPSKPW